MKICNVVQRYPPAVGGSETWCQEVSRYVAKQGNEVSVLTLDVDREEEFWRDPPPEDCILRFGPCNYDGDIFVRRYHRSIPNHTVYHTVYKFLDKALGLYFYGPHSFEMYGDMSERINASDIVHTHTIPYPHNFISYLKGKISGKPVIITPYFHPNHPHYERKAFYLLQKRCDAIITLSQYEKDYLAKKGVPHDKIFVTGAGVHPENYNIEKSGSLDNKLLSYGIDDTTIIVTFIGRKTDYKGVDLLIRAAKKILTCRKDIKFLLIGPSFPWFDQLYQTLSSEEREYIIDVGYISDQKKINILHRSNILCLPSKFESFGIVYLEAWLCNTPVIGSDQGAQPSVIEEDGLIFKYGDINDLTEKILYLIDNENVAASMAKNGRKKVLERYTWDKIGEEVLDVYEIVLNQI